MVFAKNEDGGILPQSRRVQRNAAIAKGYAEANKNYQAYSDDLKVLKDLNKQLDNNGQAITDNEQRMAKANEATKNASQRAKDYGKQIATNAKTLTDFKRENEVEKPDQQKQGKWSDGLKSMGDSPSQFGYFTQSENIIKAYEMPIVYMKRVGHLYMQLFFTIK